MAILKVLLDGRELYNINLARGREYFIGRADTCDVVLNKSSISRQHMKVFYDGQAWQIELVSRFAKFTHLGQDVNHAILSHGEVFIIEGYEFRFIDEIETPKEVTPASPDASAEAPAQEAPPIDSFVPAPGGNLSPDATATSQLPSEISADRTAVATKIASPCFHATNEETGEEVLYTLEGSHWIAGRSSSCQIRLSESKSSRQHFELCRTTTGYEIIDLGSSNGTYLNEKRLTPQARTTISFGDVVRVGKTNLTFEMRNPHFEEQLAQISDQFDEEDSEDNSSDFAAPMLRDSSQEPPAVIKYEPQNWDLPPEPATDNKKRNFRIAVGGVIAVAIVLALTNNQPKSGVGEGASNSPTNDGQAPMKQLTAEEKKLVENTYNLVKTLIMQRNFSLAKRELEKLHKIVPFYLESRELEEKITAAIQTEKDLTKIKEQIEKQRQTAENVKSIVKECGAKVGPAITAAQMEACLRPAVEMDPENREVQALMDKASEIEDSRRQNQIAQESKEMQIRKGLNMFAEAQKAEGRQDYLNAIDLYNKFANSNLPDPQNNKSRARSAVANLHSKIKAQISQNISKAEQLKSQEKYREAYAVLEQAMKWDPSDAQVRQAILLIKSDLTKKMKTLYGDGVLEETIGNIEVAKQKWRAIRDQDLINGEYYKKAMSKLKRHGE